MGLQGAPRVPPGRRSAYPLSLTLLSLAALVFGLAIGFALSQRDRLPVIAEVAGAFTAAGGPSEQGLGRPGDTPVLGVSGPASMARITPEKWDFGEVELTDVVTHSFRLVNAGGEDLQIRDVTTSCGCTSATISSMLLGPGDGADVVVTYSPGHHQSYGPVLRYVYIDSNDPVSPRLRVEITADVVRGSTGSATRVGPAGAPNGNG